MVIAHTFCEIWLSRLSTVGTCKQQLSDILRGFLGLNQVLREAAALSYASARGGGGGGSCKFRNEGISHAAPALQWEISHPNPVKMRPTEDPRSQSMQKLQSQHHAHGGKPMVVHAS